MNFGTKHDHTSALKDVATQLGNQITDLREQITAYEKKQSKLHSRRGRVESDTAVRDAERQQTVMAALADDDSAAQSKLHELQRWSEQAVQELRDIDAALVQIDTELQSRRNRLEVVKRQLTATEARALIHQRELMSTKIEELIAMLLATFRAADAVARVIQEKAVELGLREGGRDTIESALQLHTIQYVRVQWNRTWPQGWVNARSDIEQNTLSALDRSVLQALEAQIIADLARREDAA